MDGHHIFLAPFMEDGGDSEMGHHAAHHTRQASADADAGDYDPHHHHHDIDGAAAVLGPIATGLVAFAGALFAIRLVREFLAPTSADERMGQEGEAQSSAMRSSFGSHPPTFQPFGGRSHRLSGDAEDPSKRTAGTTEDR